MCVCVCVSVCVCACARARARVCVLCLPLQRNPTSHFALRKSPLPLSPPRASRGHGRCALGYSAAMHCDRSHPRRAGTPAAACRRRGRGVRLLCCNDRCDRCWTCALRRAVCCVPLGVLVVLGRHKEEVLDAHRAVLKHRTVLPTHPAQGSAQCGQLNSEHGNGRCGYLSHGLKPRLEQSSSRPSQPTAEPRTLSDVDVWHIRRRNVQQCSTACPSDAHRRNNTTSARDDAMLTAASKTTVLGPVPQPCHRFARLDWAWPRAARLCKPSNSQRTICTATPHGVQHKPAACNMQHATCSMHRLGSATADE